MPSRSLPGVVLIVVLAAAGGCTSLPPRPELPISASLPVGSTASLDRLLAPEEARHEAASGFSLVADGPTAFALRAAAVRAAERSIDIQTYIWHDDLTGKALADAVLEAADRGVRVRMLLDDLDARAKNRALLALDSHPNIEVRVFHPFASRSGGLAMFGEMMGSFGRLNRRMHAKNWIVDNRLALSGGRNVGDEYFTASEESNFADLDYAIAGPMVRGISESFDRYWNHDAVYPVALLSSTDEIAEASLDAVRSALKEATSRLSASPYAATLLATDRVQRLVHGDFSFVWTPACHFAADAPDKDASTGPLANSSVLAYLLPRLQEARQEVLIASPYFVPGEAGTRTLAELARRGVRVRILTNSLAANDVAAVHGGYARYRRALLEAGIELWELKPHDDTQVALSFLGQSNASLHAKALSIDHDAVFVGSYNLDPRSTRLNNEQGVMVTHPVVGTAFAELFARETEGARAWRVTLQDGELRWSDGTSELDDEPDASLSRRFQAWLARVLPVEPML